MAVYRTGAVGMEASIEASQVIGPLLSLLDIQESPTLYQHRPNVYLFPLHIDAAACAALVLLSPSTTAGERATLDTMRLALTTGPDASWRRKRSDVDQAIARLETLRALLLARQQLLPFHGIARWRGSSHYAFPNRAPWIPAIARTRANATMESYIDWWVVQKAWQLLALAHVSPPLLLFSRPPSLQWFQRDMSLTLRWFGLRKPATVAT